MTTARCLESLRAWRLSDEERAERRAQDRELTIRPVAQLRTSPGWQAWLRVGARTGLRHHSLRNQLLIALQKLASHCLLERNRLRIRSNGRVNSRGVAGPRSMTTSAKFAPCDLDRMSRHRHGT